MMATLKDLEDLMARNEKAGERSAHEVLDWSRGVVGSALRAAVDDLPDPMRRIAGYHAGWWDEHGRPATSDGGKAIRPALVLLAAGAVGGGPHPAGAVVAAAVSVELVHDFSLLHDDVMDEDLTRRHRPTAWSVFGAGPAILTGDALLALAFDVLAASGHPEAPSGMRMLSAAVQDLTEGQAADMAFERRTDVDLPECRTMAAGKTGALLGCACALGASFGGGSPEQVRRLRDFGAGLGLAFQHVDDLLGIWGDPAATGKPVHSDLRSRKKSLPVVAALTSGTPAGRELAGLYHRDRPLSDADLVHAAKLIEMAGGRTHSQAEAVQLLTQALRLLRSAELAQRPAAELTSLARLITRRHR